MPKIYRNVALIECGDAEAAQIVESTFGHFIVQRLSDTVFVVDHERVTAIVAQMRRQGITPKETAG